MFKQALAIVLLSIASTSIAEKCALSLTGPSAATLQCSPDANHLSTTVLTFV